jgi:hypothetical protein
MSKETEPVHKDLYAKAFRDHFSDYGVLKSLAGQVKLFNGQVPALHFGYVEERYQKYLTEANINDSNRMNVKYFGILASNDLLFQKLEADGEYAKYLVDIYEAAYNNYIINLIKNGLKLSPKLSEPPVSAAAATEDASVDAENASAANHDTAAEADNTATGTDIAAAKTDDAVAPDVETDVAVATDVETDKPGVGPEAAGVAAASAGKTVSFATDGDGRTRGLIAYNQTLEDLSNSDIRSYGTVAVTEAREEGNAAIRYAIDTINTPEDTDYDKASADNMKSKRDLMDSIPGYSKTHGRPLKKRAKEKDFEEIQGIINGAENATVASVKIHETLDKYANHSISDVQKSKLLGYATLFRTTFVDSVPTYLESRSVNAALHKAIIKKINAKFGNASTPVAATNSGGAARDGTSVWSWFWIAQGLALVVVTAVVQSVN